MHRRKRLRSVSKKRLAVMTEYISFVLGLKALVGHACEFCHNPSCQPLDPHHTRKPRSEFLMDPETVIILGRRHHDQVDAPYPKGRLVIRGTRSSGWRMRVVHAPDKFSLQSIPPTVVESGLEQHRPLRTGGPRAAGATTPVAPWARPPA